MNQQKGQEILLTILIPTYKRSLSVFKLLKDLVDHDINYKEVEILVAINLSDHRTDIVVESFLDKLPNLRFINFTSFATSCEKNISRSIEYCSGKYIFILGDDDLVIKNTFNFLISILRRIDVPAIIFNNIMENQLLHKDYVSKFSMGKAVIYREFNELVKDFGFASTMSFISRYVFRKDTLIDFEEYIKIAPIFSHVFAFIDYLHDKEVLLVDMPLIARELSDSDSHHRMTTDVGKYFSCIYGEEILSNFDYIIKKQLISKSFFFEIKENPASIRYEDLEDSYLWQQVATHLTYQSLHYLKNNGKVRSPLKESLTILKSMDSSVLCKKEKLVLEYFLEAFEKTLSSNLNNHTKSYAASLSRNLKYCLKLFRLNSNYNPNITFGHKIYLKIIFNFLVLSKRILVLLRGIFAFGFYYFLSKVDFKILIIKLKL